MKPTQSHWHRSEAHAGADSVAADADVVDQLVLGQKPCRWRSQLFHYRSILFHLSYFLQFLFSL